MSPSFLNNSITKNVAIAAIACAILAACQGAGEGQSLSSLIPPATPTPITTPTPVTSPTPVELKPAVISVSTKFPEGVTTILHQRGDWTKPCSAIPGSTSIMEKSVDCVLEVNELDLFMSKFDIALEAPPATCSYGLYSTYFFYTHSYGTGPTAVEYNQNHQGVITSLINDGNNGTSRAQVRNVNGTSSLVCSPFDHTASQGPNCCSGNYTATVHKFKEDGSSDGTVIMSGNWGGSEGNCIQGAGVAGVGRSPSGRPYQIMFPILGGGKKSFSNESAIDKSFRSSVFASNYIRTGDPMPAAINPNFQKYAFICFDYSEEVLATITLEIREWNMVSEFVKREAGDSDVEGVEPDYLTPLNDSMDWFDFAHPAGSAFRTGGFPEGDL